MQQIKRITKYTTIHGTYKNIMGKEIMQCTGKMYVIDTLLFANAQE